MAKLLGILVALAVILIPDKAHFFLDESRVVLLIMWTLFSLGVTLEFRSWLVFLALMLTGVSGIQVFASPFTHYGDQAVYLDGPAAQALVWVALVTSLVTYSARWVIETLHSMYELLAFITALLALSRHYGALGVYSLDSCLVALLIPSVALRKGPFTPVQFMRGALMAAAVLLSQYGATGIFMLVAILIAHAVLQVRRSVATWVIPSVVFTLGLGFFFQGKQLLQGSGRAQIWKASMDWWRANADLLSGTGLGTFQILGVGIQAKAGLKESAIYMHNEYLQLLFESGYLGLLVSLMLFLLCLYRTYKTRSWVFLSLAALSVMSLTQSPFRLTLVGVYVALLLREALLPEKKLPKWEVTDWRETKRMLDYVYNAE